ncbi:MAG: phospholipase D family protein [Planctomycetota bacterium]|jgi:phosphatidylserine/phosphatidylglycerophosphate/cardiolipin synthase-like enzyme
MFKVVLNREHLDEVLRPALEGCRHRLLIASADVKNLHVPANGRAPGSAESILDVFDGLAERSVEIRLLHGGIPSGPFLERLKEGLPATLAMRRCPRVHLKAVIADARWMYLGSANFTGAGLGAKSAERRNFEAGVVTDDPALIDPVADLFDSIWGGDRCGDCGRQENCPVPLEQPQTALCPNEGPST